MTITRTPVTKGIPDFMFTTLAYHNTIPFTTTTGVAGHNVYRAMSPYDPDFTGVGTQPSYFDRYMQLYNRYAVRATKIEVVVADQAPGTPNAGNVCCAITPSRNSGTISAITSVAELQEIPYNVFWVTGPTSLGAPAVKRTLFMSTQKFLGTKLEDTEISGADNANPVNNYYFTVSVQAVDQSTTLQIQAYVKITYYVKFFSRKISLDA